MTNDALAEAIDAAIRGARRRRLEAQGPEGSWNAICDMGPACTAQVAVARRFIGRLDEADAAAIARWLTSRQRADGSFVGHPGAAEGNVAATACAWAGLRAAGLPDEHEAVRAARGFVERHGGRARLLELWRGGELGPLFLAMAGALPAEELDAPPSLFAILPGTEAMLEQRLSVILPFRMRAVGALLRHLRPKNRLSALLDRAVSATEGRRCLETFDRFSNQDGSWLYGDTLHGALTLAALHALGLPREDWRFVRGLAWLERQARRDEEGLSYCIFQTDVWTTAFDLRALLASGASATSPAVTRGLSWLVGCQRRGTWAFQAENTSMPDCDDAAVALATLGRAAAASPPLPAELAARVQASIAQARRWLLDRQNRDGGWASFQHDLPSKPPGPFMTTPPRPEGPDVASLARLLVAAPPELGDPATEDVTGRVLYGLGTVGHTASEPAIGRAIEFLRGQQCQSGAFWGRWVVNYLAATSWVLRGLARVGADLGAPWVRRAIEFLLAHQNEDGGFGEGIETYRDPATAGRGASTSALTGLVLSALVEVGEGGSPQAARAARYLLAAQHGGTWPDGPALHALVPPDLFYTLPGAEHQLPLEALGLYAARARAAAAGTASDAAWLEGSGSRWSAALLDAAGHVADPPADELVAGLLAARPAAPFELLQRLGRGDDLALAELPEQARRHFGETAALPHWAEPARIRAAQALFERWGWLVATSLFCSSLPRCYAFPNGARLLGATGAIDKQARRRLVETAQFVFDVAQPGGLGPGSRGVRAAQTVRLVHAGARAFARQRGWDAAWGAPISQQQLAGTLMTFSCVVTDGLEALGVELDATDAEDWLHLWKVVGHLIGIDDRLLPRDVADGQALLRTLTRRYAGPSTDGARLAQATAALMQELLPGAHFDGLYYTLTRHLAGDDCADLLGLPRADWTQHLVRCGTMLDRLANGLGERSPVVVAGQRAGFLVMRGVSAWARDGRDGGASLRVPGALVARWEAEQGPRLRV